MTEAKNDSHEMRVNRVLAEYLAAKEKDASVHPDAWLARYPDLADDLRSFFAAESQLGKLAAEFPADPSREVPRPTVTPRASDQEAHTQDYTPGPRPKHKLTAEELALLGPALRPGCIGSLAHYDVLELAGRGGMGVVFKARDTKLQRIIAVKFLAPHLAADGTARQRFVREAQAAAAIRDQHVVSIHAVEADGPAPYLIMEFIDGVTLDQQIKSKGPCAVKEVLRIGMQAAEGLAAAHRQGLIHRDIKPANILLENGVQRVKITDFGLARAGDNVSLTQSGIIAGTPLYMAPEQARGEKVDHRTDLFSLGSVLYTLCTGWTAFGAPGTMAVLKRVCDETPRPIREINREVPAWLAAIVDKLLAKDPAARYQSAAEVAALLADHLARLNYSGPVQPVPRDAAGQRTRRLLFIAAGGAALLGLAALLLIVATSGWPGFHKNANVAGDTSKDRLPTAADHPQKIPPITDPRVLTVSQQAAGGGRFRTINDALRQVEPGQTIRILDDASYDECVLLNRVDQHRGVTLEAVGNATIHSGLKKPRIVWIQGVPDIRLRGLRIEGHDGNCSLVLIDGRCPGVVLERLRLTAKKANACVEIEGADLSQNDAPIVIQDCDMNGTDAHHGGGVQVAAFRRENADAPSPCAGIVIRNNTLRSLAQAIELRGAVRRTHVVGNRILDCKYAAIDLTDLLPGTSDVLLANNTLLRNNMAIRVWDDTSKGKAYLQCKNIRIQNNLVLESQLRMDMGFYDCPRGKYDGMTPGDVKSLQASPEWRFSHNWRELARLTPAIEQFKFWIPEGPSDRLQAPIEAGSRTPEAPDFLRPPKDSPLARAGVHDGALPAYVGAVPPAGVAPWNWDRTWDALARRVLTVSRNAEDGGRFRTINDALDNVEPGMTIRVLDDAVYDEYLAIKHPERQRGVTLEAAKNAVIRRAAKASETIWIKGVPAVTLRGFKLRSKEGLGGQSVVFITGAAAGVVLEQLDFAEGHGSQCVELRDVPLSSQDAPITIQHCTMRDATCAIMLHGKTREVNFRAQWVNNVIVRSNRIQDCEQAVVMSGACQRMLIAGNQFTSCRRFAVDLVDPLAGTSGFVVANNTFWKNKFVAFRVKDDHRNGKEFLKCRNMRFQNNLILAHQLDVDMVLVNQARTATDKNPSPASPGDLQALALSPEWRFSHNWRELTRPPADSEFGAFWIPPTVQDHLQAAIKVRSDLLDGVDFPRPARESPMATGGAGNDTGFPLPRFVGAVPPDETTWDWNTTWQALLANGK